MYEVYEAIGMGRHGRPCWPFQSPDGQRFPSNRRTTDHLRKEHDNQRHPPRLTPFLEIAPGHRVCRHLPAGGMAANPFPAGATTGPYAKIRHPQYVAFAVIMFGFLLQWPTLITLVMFPILVFMYVRLAKHEERESEQRFGQAWLDYAARTPRFIPKLPGNHRLRAH